MNGSTEKKGGTSSVISKTIAVDAEVGNEIKDDEERIVRVVVDNSCRKDRVRKEEGITEQKEALDKHPTKTRAFVYKGDPRTLQPLAASLKNISRKRKIDNN